MRAPGAHRARIALGQPDPLELLRRVQPERRVLVPQRRREAVAQPAAVRDDEDVLAGNDLEQIAVDQPQRLDLHRELLRELALERLLCRLADLQPAARQLPLDTLVPDDHDLAIDKQDPFDRNRKRGRRHSITRSARNITDSAIFRCWARAVARFTTSSITVGSWTGRSAGRVPRRTRSTYSAARTDTFSVCHEYASKPPSSAKRVTP